MPLLSCHNVAFAYEGTVVASEINLSVNAGDYLYIVGENGSGKSTLVKGMLGLLSPCNGKIEYGDGLKRNEIGYLPQRTAIQRDFPASVWEVVSSGCTAHGLFLSQQQRREVQQSMALMSIEDIRGKSFMDLSGGQQQRVLLARALCATQKLLLLDEPVAGLDPVVTKEMYELIDKLHREHQITIIMISHDLTAATRYAKHILHLRHQPLFYGTAEEYVRSDIGKTFAGGECDA